MIGYNLQGVIVMYEPKKKADLSHLFKLKIRKRPPIVRVNYNNGKLVGVATNVQMPEFNSDEEFSGQRSLSDINGLSITGALSDFEFAKAEDNTPDKLVMRAIIEAQNTNKKISAIKMRPDFYHNFYAQFMDRMAFTADVPPISTFWGFAVEVDEQIKQDFEITTH